MNEQECLQRVIDILADNVYVLRGIDGDKGIILDMNMDGVQMVAREICDVFKQPQKDTRSRRERSLDANFERMGVKPHVHHFTKRKIIRDVFNAVTVATIEINYNDISAYIEKNTRLEILEQATHIIKGFKKMGVYGVAICDNRDPFNKRYGRNKAKGKLWQHLLKEAQKK